jgi:hypothetical protein
MGQMFADDVAAGRAKDVPYKENIHMRRLARRGSVSQMNGVRGADAGCGPILSTLILA